MPGGVPEADDVDGDVVLAKLLAELDQILLILDF